MKIVTVNVPEAYIEAIKKLIGKGGLYPSRSELIRVAVHDFLLRELNHLKQLKKDSEEPKDPFDDINFVRVPIDLEAKENNEPKREYKTYKILRKLSF